MEYKELGLGLGDGGRFRGDRKGLFCLLNESWKAESGCIIGSEDKHLHSSLPLFAAACLHYNDNISRLVKIPRHRNELLRGLYSIELVKPPS